MSYFACARARNNESDRQSDIRKLTPERHSKAYLHINHPAHAVASGIKHNN
jgi:hypothetical protein